MTHVNIGNLETDASWWHLAWQQYAKYQQRDFHQHPIFCPFYAWTENLSYKSCSLTFHPRQFIEIHYFKMQQRENTIHSDKSGMITACKD